MYIYTLFSFTNTYTLCTYLSYLHTQKKTYSDPFLNALVLIPVPRFGAWCVNLMTASAAPHGKWMSTRTRKAAHWMKR